MNDPFSALKNAIQSIFHLEAMRKGRYVYPEIQQLKDALEGFQPDNKRNFVALLNTLRAALPYIEKWRIDFNTLRTPLDSLAKKLNLPMIHWDTFLSQSKASPKFQFSALNHKHKESELLSWMAAKSGKNPDTQFSMLMKYHEHSGFSQKLSIHLKTNPGFLFQLIMESVENFKQIAHKRLVLFLTDVQLAKAIIKHIPSFVQHNQSPVAQATELVDNLNTLLSNGRSVSTLLKNADAKVILDSSELLQIYQNGDPNPITPKI